MTVETDFLACLLVIGEKSGEIARKIRSDPILLRRLIEEKSESDKNARFDQDFKTLTDVLIQEIAKAEIIRKFPNLESRIFGEENGEIVTKSGKTVKIRIGKDVKETKPVLMEALDGDLEAADSLAILIHKSVEQDCFDFEFDARALPDDFDIGDLGIWIDPIDGTNVYITPDSRFPPNTHGLVQKGLENVTVLIGAFSVKKGVPLFGVVNQPFHVYDESEKRWIGQVFYAAGSFLSPSNTPQSFPSDSGNNFLSVLLSSADPFISNLRQIPGLTITTASGAGYKLLCVILGFADIFVCSMPSTFFYDTCAPHAILRGINGVGLLRWTDILKRKDELLNGKNKEKKRKVLEECQVLYKIKDDSVKSSEDYCNSSGILAYRSEVKLEQFFALMSQNGL